MNLITLRLFVIAFLFSFAACSPYSSQIRNLDRDYRAGRIPAKDYYAQRSDLMAGDSQWHANFAAGMNAVAANMNQTAANINEQNAVNAYNARTQVYAQPQQVNVYHSGTVNQNVNGRINVYGY